MLDIKNQNTQDGIKIKILASSEILKCPNLKNTPNMRFAGEGVANKVFIGCIDLDCKNKAAFVNYAYF